MIIFLFLIFAIMPKPALAQDSASLKATAVAIPGGSGGIGFDDMVYSADLHKVLVPAGHMGKLYLIDPSTEAMTSIDGFTSSPQFQKGHHTGISSVDQGDGYIFTADHGSHMVLAIDVKTRQVVAQAALAGDPDIVRYVAVNHEVWVTQPDDKNQVEVFSFTTTGKPALAQAMVIPVPSGPESLTIDNTNHKAYTNAEKNTVVMDMKTHTVTATWPNGCDQAHGTAIDEKRNFLFVACKEGKAVVLDLNQNGKVISSLTTGAGPDLVSYNPSLSHFYISGSKSATLSVLGVSSKGELSLLGVGQAAERSHCVVSDEQNDIWVCDPHHGQLLQYKDLFPVSQ